MTATNNISGSTSTSTAMHVPVESGPSRRLGRIGSSVWRSMRTLGAEALDTVPDVALVAAVT